MRTSRCLQALGWGLALLITTKAFAVEQFAINIGSTVSDGVPAAGAGRIDLNTDYDLYTFAATNGQVLFFEELGNSGTFGGYLRWELKAPSGALVFNTFLDSTSIGRQTLQQNGTYTLRVYVSTVNPAYIGTYSFRIRPIPADHAFAIQIGDTITNGVPGVGAGNIEVPGAWDYYTFIATAGQLAFFEAIYAASTFQGTLYWELKTPASNSVFTAYLTAGGHPGRKTLPETGTYRLRVFVQSSHTNYLGTYSVRIRAIPPDPTFAIQPGDTVTNGLPAMGAGHIEMPGAQDFYTFNGTAGQSLGFQGITNSATFAGNLRWEVTAPSGAAVFDSYFGDAGRKTLPETGTYLMRVWVPVNNPAYVGTYSFRIYTLPGDIRCAIQKGNTVSNGVPVIGAGRIEQPGGLDVYTFDGLAGQRVNFDQLSADAAFAGWLYWQAFTPGGSILFSGYYPGNLRQQLTLPETGTYTIRVYPQTPNAAYVGAYSFRIWCDVAAGPDQFSTLPNTPLAIPLNKFLCNDRLEIGDVPTVDTTNNLSMFGGTLALTNEIIRYTPPPGFSGQDQFSYRLRGEFGDEDYGAASVRVFAGADRAATVVSQVREGTSNVLVCLLGAPNQGYTVEQSDDLETWTELGPLTADAMGSMTYQYVIQPVEKRFYCFRRQ